MHNLQHWQRKGPGLARARLRRRQHIAAAEDEGHGLRLNGRWQSAGMQTTGVYACSDVLMHLSCTRVFSHGLRDLRDSRPAHLLYSGDELRQHAHFLERRHAGCCPQAICSAE